jgi:uncharacterized protein YfeS
VRFAGIFKMNLNFFTRSYNRFGGNKHFGLIGKSLTRDLGSFGDAVEEIDVTAFFDPIGPPRRTLEQSYEDYKKNLPNLPKIRFYKTKRRLVIEYRSSLSEDEYQWNYGPSTPELILKASNELQEILRLGDAKLKGTGFDTRRFHEEVAALVERLPSATEGLEALRKELEQWRQDRIRQTDPWDLLDIDWKKYHPRARELLNDVFFWSLSDDFAPHGNDTGADLLADFRKWNKRNPQESAHRMVSQLMKAWGFQSLDPHEVDEALVLRRDQEHPHDSTVLDEALVAAAFAAIKLRGGCDPETRELALYAIQREAIRAANAAPAWEHADQRRMTLEKMRLTLLSTPG